MSGLLRRERDGIRLELAQWEADVLGTVLELLDSVGEVEGDPAADRLNPAVYPDDPQATDEFVRLMEEEATQARRADRSAFELTLEQATAGVTLSDGEAGAWLRVIGEARLTLAARLGIEEDGWEATLEDDPGIAFLHYLGWLQASLVEQLEDSL